MKKKLWLDDPDEPFDDEEEWDDDPEDDDGTPDGLEVDGPSFVPVFTGLLRPNGTPILRHPVVMRMGYHPESKKYYTPTLDESDTPGAGAVVQWVYEV